jgi:hypothetical protein
MKHYTDLVHPTHCFCQIPEAELRPWVIKKYVEGRSTIELINSTNGPREKEIISIVATLDLDEDTMLELMGGVDRPTHHIIHCREDIKRMLGLSSDT